MCVCLCVCINATKSDGQRINWQCNIHVLYYRVHRYTRYFRHRVHDIFCLPPKHWIFRQPNVQFFAKCHHTLGCIRVSCMSITTGNFVNNYTFVATAIAWPTVEKWPVRWIKWTDWFQFKNSQYPQTTCATLPLHTTPLFPIWSIKMRRHIHVHFSRPTN